MYLLIFKRGKKRNKKKKKITVNLTTGAMRCHFKSFSINLLKFPFKEG